MECNCPLPVALVTVPNVACPQKIGQIQKFIFQRKGHVFDVAATPTPNPITALASWTPLLSAVDETKVVITPWLQNVVIPAPEAVTKGGGDNSTLNGRELVVGETNPVVTGEMRNVPGNVIAALKGLTCYADIEDLVMYGLNEFNQLVG